MSPTPLKSLVVRALRALGFSVTIGTDPGYWTGIDPLKMVAFLQLDDNVLVFLHELGHAVAMADEVSLDGPVYRRLFNSLAGPQWSSLVVCEEISATACAFRVARHFGIDTRDGVPVIRIGILSYLIRVRGLQQKALRKAWLAGTVDSSKGGRFRIRPLAARLLARSIKVRTANAITLLNAVAAKRENPSRYTIGEGQAAPCKREAQ